MPLYLEHFDWWRLVGAILIAIIALLVSRIAIREMHAEPASAQSDRLVRFLQHSLQAVQRAVYVLDSAGPEQSPSAHRIAVLAAITALEELHPESQSIVWAGVREDYAEVLRAMSGVAQTYTTLEQTPALLAREEEARTQGSTYIARTRERLTHLVEGDQYIA